MTPPNHVSRNRTALCAVIAISLLSGTVRAQSESKKSANPATRPRSAPGSKVTTPSATISVEEALQLTKKSPKDPSAYLALGGAYRRAGRYQDAANAFKHLPTDAELSGNLVGQAQAFNPFTTPSAFQRSGIAGNNSTYPA